MAYRGDYPSDGVYPTEEPVREKLPYNIFIPVILAIILIAVILVVVNVYVNWIVLEAMYELKFGLDWFRTVFYNNYSFLVAASMPLLFINPYPGKRALLNLDLMSSLRVCYPVDVSRVYACHHEWALPVVSVSA